MELNKYIQDQTLTISVIPKAKKTELKEKDGQLKLYLQAVPEKGKANQEIITFFKKKYHLKVRILSGLKNRKKVLLILI